MLPEPVVNAADPAAGFLAGVFATDPDQLITILSAAPVTSIEVGLRLARTRMVVGDLGGANADLDGVEAVAADDWRITWYRALAALAEGDVVEARVGFEEVYDLFPGEAAPKLAIAACAELAGEPAAHYCEVVWRTDQSYVSAAFGLARARLAQGDRAGAVATLETVPESSTHHLTAQVAAVHARLAGAGLTENDLVDAGSRLERLALDIQRRELLSLRLLETALGWVDGASPRAPNGVRLLGADLTKRGLRIGLERSYRALARLTRDADDRVALVDRANAARPWTLV
jgi:serine/threonine-protein kinase PknG